MDSFDVGWISHVFIHVTSCPTFAFVVVKFECFMMGVNV